MGLTIYFVNESTLLSEHDTFNIAWACDYQAQYHFGRSGWRSDVRCVYVPKALLPTLQKSVAIMHFLDDADQQGALGYHDEDGNQIPYGRVFVKTAQEANDPVSEVASHEALELAADPYINDSCLTGDGKMLYAKEVGDPVQGNAYDIGDPYGKKVGIVVADFVLPNYFDPNTPADSFTSFRHSIKGPFALAPQGYYSYIDLSNAQAGWQQKVGSERKEPVTPDADDRTGRR